jgi:hypothetical protein
MGIKMTSLSQLIERTKNDYTVSECSSPFNARTSSPPSKCLPIFWRSGCVKRIPCIFIITKLEAYTVRLGEIHQLDFIVIMNMQGIRLTHPDRQKISDHSLRLQ